MNVRSSAWRRLAYGGARYGPNFWVAYSPVFFGALFACLLADDRARIRASLRLTRGVRGRLLEHADVLRTFVTYAHCLAESLAADRSEARDAQPTVLGAEHLRAALADGRGAVVVTAHTGAWDAAARWLARDHRGRVLLVMAREADPAARALQDEVRKRVGVSVAHVGEHPLEALPVLRHLRAGGIVALQLDRVSSGATAIDTSLLGERFAVPAGPFHLARLGGAPIVPVFTRRLGYFRYEVEIRPPIRIAAGNGRERMLEAAARATEEMGRFLHRNPTQWFHFVSSPRERSSNGT